MNTPIVDMLHKYANLNALRLHMPSHKGKLFDTARYDITELSFSDNLQLPSGVIRESQELFSREWGAQYAHYLVGGSTLGVMAMIKNAQGSILMQRSSHMSAYNAVKIFNKTAYIINDYDDQYSPNHLTKDDITEAIAQHNDIKTILLTSPSYFGVDLPLQSIYDYAHTKGITVYVDSAHGAHYGLSPLLPPSAIHFADAVTISTHKTLTALTQTAVLLVKDKQLSTELKNTINMLQTTSPSYLLLASIDYARGYAMEHKGDYDRLYLEISDFVRSLPKGIERLPSDDFTRLTLTFDKIGLTGIEAEKLLNKHNIYVELADNYRIVIILSLMDTSQDLQRLLNVLNIIANRAYSKIVPPLPKNEFDKIVPLCFNGKGRLVPLEESVGKISCTLAGLTPPCTPIVVYGETIKQWQIDLLKSNNVFGCCDDILVEE